jgi:Zn-dependent protease with chaperone function
MRATGVPAGPRFGSETRAVGGGADSSTERWSPLLQGCRRPLERRLQAILGHEYGHLSNKDTSWSVNGRCWSAGGWFARVALINPGRWVVCGYLLLFGFVTSGFSRMREVFAD